MGVTYVTGRAGSGKTEYILREAKAAVRAGKRVLVVTPELMTLSMEQALLADLPVLWNLEVLSPSRLQAKLRQELGGSDAVMLDDAGRAMALRAVWTQLKDGLSYYTSMSGGFLERLVSQIKELRAGELGATGLRLAADSLAEGVTRDKLYDLAAILDGYERFMAGKYMDGEDAADRFCAAAHHSRWLRDAHVFVDGFDVLPLKTCRMFLALCKACKSVTLSFRTDSGFGRDTELFAPVQEGYECLHRMVLQQGLAWTKIDLRPRQKGEPSLDHLERELFARPAVAYAKTPEGLELAALHDGELEAERAAGALEGWMRRDGLSPEEVAVVCQEPQAYAGALERAFARRGLRLYVDDPQGCAFHPAARYLLSALQAVRRGYAQEDMIRCLKSGYAPVTQTQQDELEIWMLENSVSRRDFLRPVENKRLAMALSAFLAPLEYLREGGFARRRSVKEFCRLCYGFMEKSGLKTRLNRAIARFERLGQACEAGRCAQAWDETLRILDQAVEICGEETLDPGEFLQFLRAGLENTQLMALPQDRGAVYFGSLRRFKPGPKLRALAVLGLNDGVLPREIGENSLLDERERQTLRAMTGQFGLSIQDLQGEAALERFLIYSALVAPRERLFLSYALASLDGQALRPSPLVKRLQDLFPALQTKGGLRADEAVWYGSRTTAQQLLEQELRALLAGGQADEEALRLYAALRDHAPEALRAAVEAVETPVTSGELSPELAGRLYGRGRTSVSRLESFASCPYRHFVQYGLAPRRLREEPLEWTEMGTAYHDAVERFVRAIAESGKGFAQLNDEETDALMETAAVQALESFRDRGGLRRGRGRQQLSQMRSTLRRAGRTLVFQLRHSRFQPVAEERAFGLEEGDLCLTLDSGEQLSVHGRIDRVDLYVRDGEAFVRVVDYKSGDTQLNLADAFYGVRLQLFVYLDAVLNLEDAKPAGVFYFRINDPVVELKNYTPQAAQEAVEKELSLKGLVIDDLSLIGAMCQPEETSRVLPVSLTKEGALNQRQKDSALSAEEFELLRRFTQLKLKRLYQSVQQGRIEASPLADRNGESRPCKHCDYAGICGMDRSWTQARPMRVDKQEALAQMRRALEEDGHAQI